MAGDALLDRHREVLSQGRVLLASAESRITFESPFVLAARSEGRAVEHAILWVSRFAFLLSGITATLVALRAAPAMLAVVVGVWLTVAIAARLFARARRRQLGNFLIDLEGGWLAAHTLGGRALRISLGEVRVRTERSADAEAPVWIVIAHPGGRLRLGRGAEADVDRVLAVLRRHRVLVDRKHEAA